jgi:hypothetical protein
MSLDDDLLSTYLSSSAPYSRQLPVHHRTGYLLPSLLLCWVLAVVVISFLILPCSWNTCLRTSNGSSVSVASKINWATIKLFIAFLAAWWGLGQAVTGFIAWGFLCKSHCLLTAESPNQSSSTGEMELPRSIRQEWCPNFRLHVC